MPLSGSFDSSASGRAGREDAGVDVVLADPAGNQLDVLAAEVQDGDHFANHKASYVAPPPWRGHRGFPNATDRVWGPLPLFFYGESILPSHPSDIQTEAWPGEAKMASRRKGGTPSPRRPSRGRLGYMSCQFSKARLAE